MGETTDKSKIGKSDRDGILKKFHPKDRVRRKAGEGCYGTVRDVRSEVTATTLEAKENSLLVSVLWDNGTLSYFGPDGLELVK